jgi:uncharacterized membrane protein YhdT
MPVLKLNKINRWLLIVAVTWIVGFCVATGALCITGVITIPTQFRAGVFISMPFTGAATLLMLLMFLAGPTVEDAEAG